MTRRAVVVGNSDGIGLAVTRRLLDDGWRVAGLSRSPSPLPAGPSHTHHVVDVAAADYPATLGRAVDALGGVELCLFAAGLGAPTGIADLPGQTRTLEVNLLGAARTIEVVLPRMVAAGGGHIVGLSSLADVLIGPEAPGYSASKAGLTSYLASVTLAARRHGVRVTNVRFGFVDTKMAQSPVRPFMITVDHAADVVLRCLRRGPAVVSYPRRTALAVRLLRVVGMVRLRLGRM
jgi:NAD(P)-dependent dehydrogenase (short-subunit alcohol dehydrogenase family)